MYLLKTNPFLFFAEDIKFNIMDILKLRGISLFVVAFCLLILALIFWQKSEKNESKIWLGLAALFSALYAFFCGGTYFFWEADSMASVYWYKTTWLGVFLLPPFIIFTYYFVQNFKYLKIKAFLLYLGAAIVSYFALATDLIVKSVYLKYPNISSLTGELDFLGRLYILVCVALILINLLKEFFKSSGFRKLQLQYFILGITIFFVTGIITTAIIPFFTGESPYYDITAYASFIWVGLTAMAIFKYHFLNIKIIATQLLVFVIWIATLINFITEESFSGRLLTGGLLIFMIVAGILLIRSVIKEVAQREQIEKLSVYKSELLSIVAHQIKNSLVVIKGYASLAGGKTIDNNCRLATQDVIVKIRSATDRLLDLLNNLLDLGHIEDGKMFYEFDKFEINQFLKEIVNDFQFVAKQNNLKLNFEPSPLDVYISGDNYKLSQVFRNLIDNAIKYTEKGRVKIKVEENQLKSEVLIIVSDSGQGMTKELIAKLFQKFSRRAEEERISGSGLGLYICKKILEDHRGKIWAESEGEGRGSKFIVSLPKVF